MGVVLDKTDPDGLKQMTMQERQAYDQGYAASKGGYAGPQATKGMKPDLRSAFIRGMMRAVYDAQAKAQKERGGDRPCFYDQRPRCSEGPPSLYASGPAYTPKATEDFEKWVRQTPGKR